ncbi:MAG TPA: family 1 glycosylhydrolase, partial [Flavitalea sp.]|nr:family 1 glycosylhydrolase [Flavitalea sp.]
MPTEIKSSSFLPEIWGGIECTINRVGNNYRDQLLYSGHYERPEDITAFATLGVSALRYPILWEKHQSAENENIDWAWTEQQLKKIRIHGIQPIAGLMHHGSGPLFTDLTDKDFPVKLARYALRVAEKFPWIEYFTPVNEPLTTARFSGLYGFWYPHHKNERSFFRMLLNQVKATVLAMRSIRAINPDAKLIQTEDLSYTHSTPLLSYQADYENKRRWLTNDLLCGLVDKKHFFWKYLLKSGISKKELQFFLDNKCAPDIIGFNYYVTSERYIDESLESFPAFTHGGNRLHRYADTEAVRQGLSKGLGFLLQEAWDRYRLPIAVTECHLSCTREEQLRWFKEHWVHCCELRKRGVDIRAITAWSLLGAYDWNSLLTRENNFYESGIFDLNNKTPRPTALAKMVRSFVNEGDYNSPLTAIQGWWHHCGHNRSAIKTLTGMKAETAPVIILGKTGTLGRAFEKICNLRSIHYITLSRQEINILDEQSIRSIIQNNKPWAIINATGFVAVDDAEINASECYDVNAIAPGLLAKIAGEYGVRFVSFSSDLVFNGDKASPYVEE